MKIETKYDIGQEVWYIDELYFNTQYPAGKFALAVILDSINYDNEGITYYCKECGEYKEENLYPTKEACEAAIKEMEDGRSVNPS